MKNDELYKKASKRAKVLQNVDEDYVNHLSNPEIKATLIDLAVYKIELEMQNDELMKTRQELYKSKEYYLSLFDYAPIGYVILNLTSEIKSINRWLIDFLKTEKPTVLGKKISDFVFHEDQDSFYFLIRDILKYKKYAQIEVRIGSQENGYYWCLVDCKMIANNEDEIFLSFVDINYKVLAERVLLEEKSKADNLNYAKSQFLANMSHEIRTPMNGILGVLQLLEFTKLKDEQLELVEISKKSALSLVNILNSILDYSKIEEKMVLFEHLEFRVTDIIDEVKSLFYPSVKDKNLSIYSNIEGSVPNILRGDAFRIKQILNNLVGNAIKFTATGEIKIIVEVIEKSNQNDVVIEFQIHDTGIGISEDALELVFERFSQADSSNTRKYGGTGLGLAISKGLTEQMGGSIRIESCKGMGTIVKFRLPLEIGEWINVHLETKYDMQNEQVGTYFNKSIE